MVTPEPRFPVPVHHAGASLSARSMMPAAVVRRHLVFAVVAAVIAALLTLVLAAAIWWVFQPSLLQLAGYAVALLALILLMALVVLAIDTRPAGRVLVITIAAVVTILCGIVPAGTLLRVRGQP